MKIRVHVPGSNRVVESKGRTHVFSDVWAYLPNTPFPQLVNHYGHTGVEPGDYLVPLVFQVREQRLSVQFNFKNSEPYKG